MITKVRTILVSAAAAATLFAASAGSASAQPYWGGSSPYSRMSYTEYFRQLRACQRHERLHNQLGREHAYEHYEGLDSPGDHRDLHGALGEAHDAYHYEQPRSDFCDQMIRSYPSRSPYTYGRRDYGYGNAPGPYGNGSYGNGYSYYGRY